MVSGLLHPVSRRLLCWATLRHAMTCHGLVILALAYHVELQNGHVVWLHTMLSIGYQPKAYDCESEQRSGELEMSMKDQWY